MFDTICELIVRDPDYPPRAWVLDTLSRVLNGQMYDVLPYHFHDERGAGGEYIPLRKRRPSVKYPLCRIVVEDAVSLLFSEGHFPTIDCQDRITQNALARIMRDCRMNLVMTDAATRGSIGSVAILMKVLAGRIFLQVIESTYLTPMWSPSEPDTLEKVTERYKVTGAQLTANGYHIPLQGEEYWFQRTWDRESEIWYVPSLVIEGPPVTTDTARTIRHGLGFVPMVWIRNLPGNSSTGDPNDGACTFRPAIDTQIDATKRLTAGQAARALSAALDGVDRARANRHGLNNGQINGGHRI